MTTNGAESPPPGSKGPEGDGDPPHSRIRSVLRVGALGPRGVCGDGFNQWSLMVIRQGTCGRK